MLEIGAGMPSLGRDGKRDGTFDVPAANVGVDEACVAVRAWFETLGRYAAEGGYGIFKPLELPKVCDLLIQLLEPCSLTMTVAGRRYGSNGIAAFATLNDILFLRRWCWGIKFRGLVGF